MDATLTMTTAGEMVRRYRELADLTQEELAPMVGVTTGMITQYEGDKAKPHRPVVERLDEVLEAGGRILKAYGFTRPGDVDDLIEDLRQELAGQIFELSQQMNELRSIVEDLHRPGCEGS